MTNEPPFEISEGDVYRKTWDLRFVKREGRFVLQQLWQEVHLGTERWEDVPLVEE